MCVRARKLKCTMEFGNSQVDPNLNAEMYRNMRAADRPPIRDKHLQFILIFDGESAILGASNLTDRYWSGTVWSYNDISNFDRDQAFIGTKTESGVCDAAYLGQRDKFVIGEDNGVIQVLGVVEMADAQAQELQCLGYACQHDDSLTTLSTFHNNTHLVTGGMDYCIRVWDIAELISSYTFSPAHTDIITCVDVQPKSDSVFVSTSLDSEVLSWDVRQSQPANCIFKKDGCGLTSVAWSLCEEHIIAVGADDGSVGLIDTRKPNTLPLYESTVFPRGVHRLRFNPDRSHEMAGCCDSTVVKVFDTTKELTLIYEDNRHKDFVRGLTWHNNQLLTCSWDDTVLRHPLSS